MRGLIALLIGVSVFAGGCGAERSRPLADGLAEAAIAGGFDTGWAHPQRRTLQIEHRPVEGGRAEDRRWLIRGTDWWVMLPPIHDTKEHRDCLRVDNLDAVALGHAYGVIHSWVYDVEAASQ